MKVENSGFHNSQTLPPSSGVTHQSGDHDYVLSLPAVFLKEVAQSGPDFIITASDSRIQ
jgi:hypothetical protein